MQSDGGEIDAQLPQGEHHEQHDQIDEQVDADQQACQNDGDEDDGRANGLWHVPPRLLVDGVDGLGFLFVLLLMPSHVLPCGTVRRFLI